MRVFVFDNGLADKSGHHYNLNLNLHYYFEANNVEARFLGPKRYENTSDQPFHIEGFFTHTIYDRFFEHPVSKRLDNFMFLNQSYFKDLERINKSSLGKEDVILIHTGTQNILLGLAQWLSRFDKNNMPYVGIFMPFAHALNMEGSYTTIAMFYSYVYQALAGFEKVFICTTSDELCDAYRDLGARNVYKNPLPQASEDLGGMNDLKAEMLKKYEKKKQGEKIRMTYLGHSRRQKNLLILPEILREITKLDIADRLEMFIQLAPAEKMKVEHGRIKTLEGDITLYPENIGESDVLEERDFYEQLVSSDIMFLPYNKKAYRYESSGMFGESAGLGKVMVLPDDTWMSKEWNNFGGGASPFSEPTPESIAAAVRHAVVNFETLSEQSKKTGEAFFKFHNLNSFMEMMFDEMGIKI